MVFKIYKLLIVYRLFDGTDAMKSFGISTKLTNRTRITMLNSEAKVMTSGSRAEF